MYSLSQNQSLVFLSDVAAEPNPLVALLAKAKLLRGQGQFDEALRLYDAVLQLNPEEADALHYSGMIAFDRGDYALAESLIQRSIAVHSTTASKSYFLVNLSILFKKQGKYQEAIASLMNAIALQPDNKFAFLNLGVTQVEVGLDDQAIANYRQAIALNPLFKEAFYNLGIALRLKGQHSEAIQCNERVIELDPLYIDAYINIAASYILLKNFNAVAAYSLMAIKINPNQFNSFYNLGIARHEQGDLVGSLAFLEHSAALNPRYMNAHCARSLVMLAMGKLDEGWKGYEFRWLKETMPEPMRHYPYPWWMGESLEGKTLLVWGEQGIGDQMMFSSMLDDVISRAKKCIFACTKKLIPLFQHSFPQLIVIDLENKEQLATVHHTIDVQSPLGSMARWLRTSLDQFPNKSQYLSPDFERVAYWKKRLADLGPEKTVGICWRSGNVSGDRLFYCTTIEQWAPVFAVAGIRFVNLQYDECSAEIAQAKQQFGVDIHAFPEVDLFDDIFETAALTKALDLVIAAPTTAGILSAALGVPTWQLVSGFNWQFLGTTENQFYTCLKTIPRQWDQSWETVMQEVAELLRKLK